MTSLQVEGQILAFHFELQDDLLPANYPPELISTLHQLSAQGPVGLLATVGPTLRVVDPRVIAFWLERMRDPAVHIRAIAVSTQKLAIKVALTAFGQTCALLGLPLQVKHTPDADAAWTWLRAALDAAARPIG